MKKPAHLLPRIAIVLCCLTSPVWAAPSSFTVPGGTTNTTAQTLGTGNIGEVDAGGTLNVSSSSVAVTFTGSSTLSNSGLIEQTGGARALRDNTGGYTSYVNNSGTISSNGDDAFQLNKPNSNSIVTNSGTFETLAGGQVLDFNAVTTGTNAVINTGTGLISSHDADAIRTGVNGSVTNDGSIIAHTTGDSGNDGIDAQTNTGAVIVNAAANLGTNPNLIEGASHGITGGILTGANFTINVTNNSNGIIKGDDGSGINIDGVNAAVGATIVNHGIISGNGVSGDGDGVDVDGTVNLTNTGTINSINYGSDTSEGVTVGGGTIVNSGLIEGSVTGTATAVGRGITLAGVDKNAAGNTIDIQKIYATTTVLNSGVIKGDSSSGIGILGFNTTVTSTYTAQNFNVTITNTAGGIIEGGGSVAAIDGNKDITVSGTGTASANNETVINYGTIRADGTGKAIDLGMGNNSVQIMGGNASVIGDMSGAVLTGTNTAALTINPGSGNSFSYSGVISNFTSVEVMSGTTTFTGANTYAGTTTIDAATLKLTGAGTIGNTTTLTIASGGVFDLGGGTVNVGTLANSGMINNGTVNASTIAGLTGTASFAKTGSSTLVMTGTYTYTGGTTVNAGKLAVNGTLGGNVNVQTGAELGGSGTVTGTLSGAGAVGPGNSPGILTAGSTDPTSGMSYNFEMTQGGTATWSNATASGNDVLHLTAALPFTAALTSANTVDLYFSSLSLTYEGGFFTDGSTDTLTANLANATFAYYLLDNTNGTVLYNGNKYDRVIGTNGVTQITGANFGTGTVNGWTETFTVAVPEPSTYVLVGLGIMALLVVSRRRANKA